MEDTIFNPFSRSKAVLELDEAYFNDETKEEEPIDIFSNQIPVSMASDIRVAESAIAKQMAALTAEAREKTYMDMHGVPESMRESSEMVRQSLKDLQYELEDIRDKPAYDLAWDTDRAYVEDEEFRLLFLRTDDMNPRLAALRIVRHFQVKLDLFGPEKLTVDITQDDLNKEDMQALYNGRARILPSKDRAGRFVSLIFAGSRGYTPSALLRRSFYNIMSNPELYSATERGIVVIYYALGVHAYPAPGRDLEWKLAKLQEALPIKAVAMHMCKDKSVQSTLFSYIMLALNAFTRLRIRMHCGSHNEVMSTLRGYGIEPNILPVNEEGQFTDLDQYHECLALRRARERMKYPRRSRIHVPSIFDVLFGKGTPYQDHTGNRRFRALIADHQKEYEKSERGEKLQVAQSVVDHVIQNTGMFLKPDDLGSWISVDNNTARSKVSSAFRTMKKQKRVSAMI